MNRDCRMPEAGEVWKLKSSTWKTAKVLEVNNATVVYEAPWSAPGRLERRLEVFVDFFEQRNW